MSNDKWKMSRLMRIITTAFLLLTSLAGLTFTLLAQQQISTNKSIYHDGWIDLNKNGRMDVYENPKGDIDKRIDNLLSQMTLEEKTCQTATLYGEYFGKL
ncbi:MAG: hypothetical protein ACREBG_26300 [Pyrinomonadaceae bacterium]